MIKKIQYISICALLFGASLVAAHGHHHHHHHGDKEATGGHGHDHHHHHNSQESFANFPLVQTLFASDSPKVLAFLATFYISVVPNLFLLFVPANISTSKLNILVSFAVGGLLGDVFLHLLPHAFVENYNEIATFGHDHITVKNVVTGLGIFAGLIGFFILDKFMRIISGNKGHSHSHGHGHDHSHHAHDSSSKSSSVEAKDNSNLRQRKSGDKKSESTAQPDKSESKPGQQSVKLSAYLNLIADATHNFTDGLAIAASFYVSKSIGITTTIAVFFHEIPHEVGDFAILLQSGFSRYQALGSQFVTAVGAFLGTVAGVLIQEAASSAANSNPPFPAYPWFFWSDLVLPVTAGGFLYIATVSVIPDLLETPDDLAKNGQEPKKSTLIFQTYLELIAALIGVSLMAIVSFYE
jgi:zinc transporter 7